MSRGLGTMQRAILGALEPAMQEQAMYRGSYRWMRNARGWVEAYGCGVRVASDVYDLRAVAEYLGGSRPPVRWQASFARAVASLVRRGALRKLWLVPLAEVCAHAPKTDRIHRLEDGQYLRADERRARFVKCYEKPPNPKATLGPTGPE